MSEESITSAAHKWAAAWLENATAEEVTAMWGLLRDKMCAGPVAQVDRDAAKLLSDWLFEATKGHVRLTATDDSFYPIQAFSRHRLRCRLHP